LRWQRASPPCFALPTTGEGGLDRNVPRSADDLRRSIWVTGCISKVTDDRFQKQKELFGKHGESSIATALAWLRYIRMRLVRDVTTSAQIELPT
jgi:hypothetical protein